MYALYFVCLGLLYVVYERLVLSSLSKVPGPAIAATTRLVLMYYEFTRRRRRWIHALHKKYGPIVRIAPDEISFATWDAAKEIYVSEGSGYDKTLFYKLFDNYETECMFSTLDRAPHGERRKRIADRYSKTFIMQPDVISGVQERAEQFVAKCTEKPGSEAVDVYIYLHCYAIDCITYHLFDPHGLNSLADASDLMKVKELSHHDNLKDSYMQYYFTELFRYTASFSRRVDRSKRIAAQIINIARRSDIAEHTVLYRLQTHEDKLDTRSIASELLDHTLAGLDTTGDGLCFLMHQLSLPASAAIQEKLRLELTENTSMPIDDLPYLDAVVKEGLRCFSPIPMSLPRKVPRGGRTIGDIFLPEETIVSCQAYTLHRIDEKVFPNPDNFVPERWLESEGNIERNQLLLAFSTGGRGCIGKHLALLEMKMLLRETYSSYRTSVASEMAASMDVDDQVIASRPIGRTCLLKFEKIM
ncbi:hypothetical protein POSPLADRAFT_1186057 [Postia placenta MAD-698-R-SB12]|uniref:Cytochrome P450 n=2 Tax=Rhodonia placenta TaxID=104341 RepID=A0A1X6MM38_9APHY|nr:hypothetical protein POSPLADRAFT_1186057 [Postia placenta MAD-698-R-SB12]OSX57143.1 hypothetical protein POSPLADRAFT_1186057 [Postia placenta MAD-698-R-SB12]BAK09447.1 cytochrome P450 [Postia placenta]